MTLRYGIAEVKVNSARFHSVEELAVSVVVQAHTDPRIE